MIFWPRKKSISQQKNNCVPLENREMVNELDSLAKLEEEIGLLTVQKLQLEAIRFSRYSLLQILDGYLSYRRDRINGINSTEET